MNHFPNDVQLGDVTSNMTAERAVFYIVMFIAST